MSIPKLWTKSELAQHLGVSVRSVERWINSKQLPPPKRLGGRRVVWHTAVIEKWINTRFGPKQGARS
ncbi:helix-turn-helix transcriptional regulator [Thioalkalivibrio sulfidiphilus]|uniref:helix-turn-helix transcriptional regulator n=1 Tax=Thioalkalivibrio sulfidiphilus TaxID=1033854 RepID=UPI003B37C563